MYRVSGANKPITPLFGRLDSTGSKPARVFFRCHVKPTRAGSTGAEFAPSHCRVVKLPTRTAVRQRPANPLGESERRSGRKGNRCSQVGVRRHLTNLEMPNAINDENGTSKCKNTVHLVTGCTATVHPVTGYTVGCARNRSRTGSLLRPVFPVPLYPVSAVARFRLRDLIPQTRRISNHGREPRLAPLVDELERRLHDQDRRRALVHVKSAEVEQHLGAAVLSGLLEHDLLNAAVRARAHDFAEVLSLGGVPPSRLCAGLVA